VIENFTGTKSSRKILKKLKRKINIFIGTKIYLTQVIFLSTLPLSNPFCINKVTSY